MPALGVGTWAWGDRGFWGYGVEFGEAEVQQAFAAALEAGVRLFDTAEIYGGGDSERILGRCIRECGEVAQSVQVATKFFPFPWRLFRRGAVMEALRDSLQRLQLERVALYQVHWPLPLLPGSLWADQLAEVVEAGLTDAVGVSNFNVRQLRAMHAALARRGIKLASNQVHYSLLHRNPERDGVLNACHELGVRVIAYSPLAQGLLSGKYSRQRPPNRLRRIRQAGRLRRAERVVPALRDIGEVHGGKTPAQVALNWLMCKGAVPIPGAKSETQARQNAGALGWQLSADELARLDRLSWR